MRYMIPFLHNIKTTIFLLLVSITFIIFKLFLKKNYTKRRHKIKIMTADKVIVKLNSFTGEFKNQQILSYLRKIDPYVFEELILSAFALKGFSIIRNKSYSGDGGLDGTVFKKDARFLVQAKRYTNWVKTSHIKDFETLISNQKANGGYFIHTGKTSSKSLISFKSSTIIIISGQKLIDLILN